MTKSQVYDLPTRIFHWIFVVLFLTAFIIAKTVDDESAVFSVHMLTGLTLTFVVLLRILWGFIGTKHARFSGFALNPKDLISYFKGILTGNKRRWAGHNPASSWAAITMMLLALGMGVTGFLMSTGNKEAFEDIHELMANSFIIIAIFHIAGLALHTVRHKEMIGFSMILGSKSGISSDQAITSSRPVAGILMLVLVVAFGLQLYKNYDTQNRSLKLFGSTLQLGENETNQESDDD